MDEKELIKSMKVLKDKKPDLYAAIVSHISTVAKYAIDHPKDPPANP